MDDLNDLGTFTNEMSRFMQALVQTKLSLLISGGTGSGKTTLLNALAKSIPNGERVITIEDSAELKFDRSNVVGMEARPPNVEGSGEVTIRNLVKTRSVCAQIVSLLVKFEVQRRSICCRL